MSDMIRYLAIASLALALMFALVWIGVSIGSRKTVKSKRRDAKRRKKARRIDWAKFEAASKRFASWLGRVALRVALAVGKLFGRIPSLLFKMIKWIGSKILIIWGILFLLGIDVFAIRMMFWVAGAVGKYQQGIFVKFLEYGVSGLAVAIVIATLIPLFPLLRRLVR
jgi:acyl-CoA synthetase (AMP-forming)/AMP-acid ligase II